MGQASDVVVVVVMSYSAARAAPLIEECSGWQAKRRSGCRGDVVFGGLCSTADRGVQWGRQGVVVVVVVMSFWAVRAAPLIEECSGAGKASQWLSW